MKIYTRTGDGGETGLFGAGRVSKASVRVEAYGAVDELNAVLGWTITQVADDEIRGRLELLQHDLFALGAELATPAPAEGRKRPQTPDLPMHRIDEMERWMDEADGELPELTSFILPGGSPGAAALHVSRTVCRRAERAAVRLMEVDGVEPADAEVAGTRPVIRYLNRLSDLLFVLARLANHRGGAGDVVWKKEGGER